MSVTDRSLVGHSSVAGYVDCVPAFAATCDVAVNFLSYAHIVLHPGACIPPEQMRRSGNAISSGMFSF